MQDAQAIIPVSKLYFCMEILSFMRIIYIVFIACIAGLTGCNNGNSAQGTAKADSTAGSAVKKAPAHSKLSDEGTQQLLTLVSKYYELKNALVATKAARADSAATQLAATAMSMQAFLQKDSANAPALKPYMDTIIGESKAINDLKDETCEKQRIVFEVISRDVYAMLKNVDLKNGGIYHEFCPMAFNEKGAYWLSSESEILNPYFGKKMLECGEVTDSM